MKYTIKAYRGEKGRPADPGDLGRGQYWSSCRHVARCYGDVHEKIITLYNPILMTSEEAYDLAGEFGTITGDPNKPHIGAGDLEKRAVCAGRMTDFLMSLGYDGIVCEHGEHGHRKPWIEIVIFKEDAS